MRVRTKNRMIVNYKDIAKQMDYLAKTYGLKFMLFKDNPAPSFRDTLQMFHDAFLVVGPHGAGMSNIIWSRPGSYVLEVLCHTNNRPRTHYMDLSWTLGHHYYGFPALSECKPGTKGLQVNTTDFINLVDYVMKQYKL